MAAATAPATAPVIAPDPLPQSQQSTPEAPEQASAIRELEWLLSTSAETLAALRSGLQECMALLDPDGPASVLALSSARSESLKGIVSRTGSHLTRVDLQVKMFGLPYTKGLQAYKLGLAQDNHTLMLDQLTDVRNYVTTSLGLLGGREESIPEDPLHVLQNLCSLQSNIAAARAALKGISPDRLFPYHAAEPLTFDPPLPSTVSFDIYISEASLVAELRTLSLTGADGGRSSFSLPDIASPFGFRERFAAAVGFREAGTHNAGEETDVVFSYHGMDVKVKEKVKVESQDPSLMAVWAKLGSVEHALGAAIKSLRMVMVAAGIINITHT